MEYHNRMIPDKQGFKNLDATDEEILSVEYPPPMHPEGQPLEPADAGVPRASLTPTEEPPPRVYASTPEEKIQAVEEFARRISGIDEKEFGDWMRRANLYWWHLQMALADEGPAVQRLMWQMHVLIQYDPDWMIIETTQNVVETALRIRHVLGGQGDPGLHDFNVSETAFTTEPPLPSYSERLENPIPPDIEGVIQDGNELGINATEAAIGGTGFDTNLHDRFREQAREVVQSQRHPLKP